MRHVVIELQVRELHRRVSDARDIALEEGRLHFTTEELQELYGPLEAKAPYKRGETI
jgi:hypothetical protein